MSAFIPRLPPARPPGCPPGPAAACPRSSLGRFAGPGVAGAHAAARESWGGSAGPREPGLALLIALTSFNELLAESPGAGALRPFPSPRKGPFGQQSCLFGDEISLLRGS